MPNDYTPEQIAADLATVSAYIENGSPLPELEDDPYWKASSASERLEGIVSALFTAEQERDALAAYAAKLEKAGDGIRASFTTFNAEDRENALTAWDAARKEKP